jgi:flavin reductase (DIM6/NTAB) family NADH-FMN oxidoreductase RutF
MADFSPRDPYELDMDPIRGIGKGWMLVTAGEMGDWNTMTASWGGLGELWAKPVAFAFVRPSRYTHGFMERFPLFTLSFFDKSMKRALDVCGSRSGRDADKAKEAGISPIALPGGGVGFGEAHTILVCEKAYSDDIRPERFIDKGLEAASYPSGDYHTMYVGKILSCLCR